MLCLPSERFVIVLYSVERIDLSISDDEDDSLNVIDRLISIVANHHADAGEKRFVFSMDGTIVCLIALSDTDDDNALEHIKSDAQSNAEYLLERFKIKAIVAISPLTIGPQKLSAAYRQTRELLDCHLLTSSGDTITVVRAELTSHPSSEEPGALNAFYSNMHLYSQQLMNHCFDSARLTFQAIMNEQFTSSNGMDSRPLRLRLHTLIDVLVLSIQEIDDGEEPFHARCEALLEDLYACESLASLNNCADAIFAEFEAHAAQSSPADERDQRIIEYIDAHYRDSEFNVSALSQHFNLSSSYISTLIKKNTGVSAVDYIQRLRIQTAKQLLKEQPAMLIKDVAQEVGYGSSLNLIRAFKRYEGITPTMYREST